jgi:hypothetical protein
MATPAAANRMPSCRRTLHGRPTGRSHQNQAMPDDDVPGPVTERDVSGAREPPYLHPR